MASGQVDGNTGNFLLSRRLKPLSTLVGAGLLGASLLAVVPQTAFITAAAAQDQQRPPSFADLADKVRPAVVSVNVKSAGAVGETSGRDVPIPDLPQDFRDFFDQFKKNQPERHPMRAQGSGFLISADGYVVTNHHVADKADEIEITFENEEKYKAKVDRQRRPHRHRAPQDRDQEWEEVRSLPRIRRYRAARWRLGSGRRQSVRPWRHGYGRHRLGPGPRHRLRPLRLPADRRRCEPRQLGRPRCQS